MINFFNMTVKHDNNILNLITGCLYDMQQTLLRVIYFSNKLCCMSYILALMDLMMVIKLTEKRSPNELT